MNALKELLAFAFFFAGFNALVGLGFDWIEARFQIQAEPDDDDIL
jgi:hypothetical protein